MAFDWSIKIEGRPYVAEENPNGDYQAVTPGYFEAGTLVLDLVDSRNNKLLKRGYTANEWTGDALTEYNTLAQTVQKRLVGRMYSQELLDRVKKIVAEAK